MGGKSERLLQWEQLQNSTELASKQRPGPTPGRHIRHTYTSSTVQGFPAKLTEKKKESNRFVKRFPIHVTAKDRDRSR